MEKRKINLTPFPRINMQCNLFKEAAGLDRDISDRLKSLVA
jgi:hypothetical protein